LLTLRKETDMFVRWETRKLIKRNDSSLIAVLVRSKREGDHVKQISIKYLGSIHQQQIHRVWARIKFWEKAEPRLSVLNLEPDVMQAILELIQKKVEKPGDLEIKNFNALVCARRKARLIQTNHHDNG
jgi:Holliday junction resolvase-like predicted endonuclease